MIPRSRIYGYAGSSEVTGQYRLTAGHGPPGNGVRDLSRDNF